MITKPYTPGSKSGKKIDTRREMESLSNAGIDVSFENEKCLRNRIVLHEDFTKLEMRARIIFGGSKNTIYIDQNCGWIGAVRFDGDEAEAVILGGQPMARLDAAIYEGSRFVWGFGSISFGVRAWIHGQKSCVIGEHCLFSEGIGVRTSDHHSIIDLKTKEVINAPADIQIGRHVWIAPNVSLNKGARIGDGSIIGAGSMVSQVVPDRELWAGTPARCLKKDVSWVASHPAHKFDIDQLETRFGII